MIKSFEMIEFKEIFREIYINNPDVNYVPEVGCLYQVENYHWGDRFASNKPEYDIHPALVINSKPGDNFCKLIPGTSKEQLGSCVFKVKLNQSNPDDKVSYFLIKKWMSYPNNEVFGFNRGWNGVDELSEGQVIDLKQQIKFCKG